MGCRALHMCCMEMRCLEIAIRIEQMGVGWKVGWKFGLEIAIGHVQRYCLQFTVRMQIRDAVGRPSALER